MKHRDIILDCAVAYRYFDWSLKFKLPTEYRDENLNAVLNSLDLVSEYGSNLLQYLELLGLNDPAKLSQNLKTKLDEATHLRVVLALNKKEAFNPASTKLLEELIQQDKVGRDSLAVQLVYLVKQLMHVLENKLSSKELNEWLNKWIEADKEEYNKTSIHRDFKEKIVEVVRENDAVLLTDESKKKLGRGVIITNGEIITCYIRNEKVNWPQTVYNKKKVLLYFIIPQGRSIREFYGSGCTFHGWDEEENYWGGASEPLEKFISQNATPIPKLLYNHAEQDSDALKFYRALKKKYPSFFSDKAVLVQPNK